MTFPRGSVIAENRLTSVTDAEGNTTSYAYDANGRVATVTDAEGGKTTYSYDAKGNVTKIVDAGGNATTYTGVAQGVGGGGETAPPPMPWAT